MKSHIGFRLVSKSVTLNDLEIRRISLTRLMRAISALAEFLFTLSWENVSECHTPVELKPWLDNTPAAKIVNTSTLVYLTQVGVVNNPAKLKSQHSGLKFAKLEMKYRWIYKYAHCDATYSKNSVKLSHLFRLESLDVRCIVNFHLHVRYALWDSNFNIQ